VPANLSASVNWPGCNLSLLPGSSERLVREASSASLRGVATSLSYADNDADDGDADAKTWISLLSAPGVGSTSLPCGGRLAVQS